MKYIASLWLPLSLAGIVSAAPMDQPAPEVVAEARSIVQEMIANPRGPYSRIRWYCNDGTTQDPVAYACRERGGGRQHAEYSTQRQRLVELGWSVGTVFAALTAEELLESVPRQQRLRELALEQYLVDVDNGWVLRNARAYRGRVQLEDEEASGREILLQILSDDALVRDNFLLVRESVRIIPHGEDSDLARTVRRTAVEMAELDATAERWRAEIHSAPNATTAGRLRAWLAERPHPAIEDIGQQLAADLDRLLGPAGRRERIDFALTRLNKSKPSSSWRKAVLDSMSSPADQRIAGMCAALVQARSETVSQLDAKGRLSLLDAMQGVESEVQLTFQDLPNRQSLSRAETIHLSRSLVDCAYGSGMLSATEHASLVSHLDVDGSDDLPVVEYKAAIAWLKRAPSWAVGTIRHTFGEALTRYTALEPKSARFSDDLLRGSPMWMLGDTLKVLSKDVDFLSGSVVQMDGHAIATAVALNGGIARGTLRILDTIEAVEGATLHASDIVVLPETIAELSPVAGILTLGEGNALSHVQLLARNFGIPNVAIGQDTVDLLMPLENTTIILVVDNDGNVLLQKDDDTTAAIFTSSNSNAGNALQQITVPLPNLSMTEMLALPDIGRELSGKVVGPKAANLGELNRLFPGRVAPAVAIPFGVYARNLQNADLMQHIQTVFAAFANGEIDKAVFDRELAGVRRQITMLELTEADRNALTDAMRYAFGEPGTYGVFVRSDTNVEDLPQFTGAGLNETIPNVVGLDLQLAAVPRVWGSVFSPRALAWRSSVLSNPEQIFASVLLMKSVPATKSGVLVTANLFDRSAPALTVSAAWGVGGAVAGEPAESIVVYDEGVDSYSEAKSPYQRKVLDAGGVGWIPAPAGPVLENEELDELRRLASEVNLKYAPVYDESGKARPWDIEFGFVDGELTLFQIRPLVERANQNASDVLKMLMPGIGSQTVKAEIVQLNELPGT